MDNMQMIRQTLTMAIFEVFEKMYYVFLEPVDQKAWEHRWTSSIGFTGPLSGEIRALFSPGLADAMVQNMLNIELPAVTDKLREDCLKESVNMIGGNFLRKYDSTKVFDLSLPFFSPEKAGALQTSASSGDTFRMDFAASEGMLGLRFSIPENFGVKTG